jgi:hypothetical protein
MQHLDASELRSNLPWRNLLSDGRKSIDKVADNGPGIRTICDSVAPLLY